MEVGEGQELENNEEIDKMADKDMIKNNDVTDRLEVMFITAVSSGLCWI